MWVRSWLDLVLSLAFATAYSEDQEFEVEKLPKRTLKREKMN